MSGLEIRTGVKIEEEFIEKTKSNPHGIYNIIFTLSMNNDERDRYENELRFASAPIEKIRVGKESVSRIARPFYDFARQHNLKYYPDVPEGERNSLTFCIKEMFVLQIQELINSGFIAEVYEQGIMGVDAPVPVEWHFANEKK